MKDAQLQQDVQNELNWDPSIHAEEIGVAVKNGVVTLSGMVNSYAEKLAAEKAAKRVLGVRGVAEDIEVRVVPSMKRNDTEIARAAVDALTWDVEVPHEQIKLKVEDGWITLEGSVDWAYQRTAAARAVSHLIGVRGVTNLVSLVRKLETKVIQRRIADAFKRNAELEAQKIRVETQDGRVSLFGQVHSWQQHDEATHVAWSAPGVMNVEDHLTVAP